MTAVGAAPMPGMPAEEWISGLRARKALDCGYSGLARLALLQKVRVLIAPGEAPKYSRLDVERIAGKPA